MAPYLYRQKSNNLRKHNKPLIIPAIVHIKAMLNSIFVYSFFSTKARWGIVIVKHYYPTGNHLVMEKLQTINMALVNVYIKM